MTEHEKDIRKAIQALPDANLEKFIQVHTRIIKQRQQDMKSPDALEPELYLGLIRYLVKRRRFAVKELKNRKKL